MSGAIGRKDTTTLPFFRLRISLSPIYLHNMDILYYNISTSNGYPIYVEWSTDTHTYFIRAPCTSIGDFWNSNIIYDGIFAWRFLVYNAFSKLTQITKKFLKKVCKKCINLMCIWLIFVSTILQSYIHAWLSLAVFGTLFWKSNAFTFPLQG